jgi:hypothetical protein
LLVPPANIDGLILALADNARFRQVFKSGQPA